ncbi:hypothetical protein GRI75_11150 [Altererythrobacter soli]|uniref:Polyhydroxyalkanoic acid system protein n=1 Tax=Croceibacterium soli TaxID=1739690 RepID=A0A6I4UUI9_9SPHN|nr:polyhydroxyalkanoic acid system family protein [Croceibacterium soli]MXP42196.1 hypothetical protein [Croceibacterium soli]
MRVAIPHDLDRETVRQRLRSRSHEIADHIPGGMAQVETAWRSEDVMTMSVRTLGQELRGDIEIEEGQLVFNMILPPALGFLQPVLESAIRQQGQKLIAPPGAA